MPVSGRQAFRSNTENLCPAKTSIVIQVTLFVLTVLYSNIFNHIADATPRRMSNGCVCASKGRFRQIPRLMIHVKVCQYVPYVQSPAIESAYSMLGRFGSVHANYCSLNRDSAWNFYVYSEVSIGHPPILSSLIFEELVAKNTVVTESHRKRFLEMFEI